MVWKRDSATRVPLPPLAEFLPPHLAASRHVFTEGEGKLGACLYPWHTETKTHASYFFTSADDGATWSIAGIIVPDGLNETTPLRLANGELIASARTYWDGQHRRCRCRTIHDDELELDVDIHRLLNREPPASSVNHQRPFL